MKKIASFIVNKKYIVLTVMLVLCIACVCMIPGVNINSDMTKYLPDDSSMKQGVNVLAEEFPDMEMPNTVRVMFKDLSEVDKINIKKQLSEIENVDSVTYDPAIHEKDGYTLFTVNTSFAYGTPEEVRIEDTIRYKFADKDVVYKNGDAMGATLPMWVIIVAFTLLMIVLVVMCSSWFEPVLFLATIGVAIAINMGSNIIFDSVSQLTFSIASILQVVLSMDYSIILMNRYRQEKFTSADNNEAMKKAIANAFSSVTSSGMTTVIGLLMLIFMSFTIGKDLGLVLAKGVLCSMLSVFTVLPVLILVFDKLIVRSAKKELHIPMGKVTSYSFKGRKFIALFFAVLFVGMYFLQNITPITYTLPNNDEISQIFPASNQIVMLYHNDDEKSLDPVANSLTDRDKVNSVLGYSTTLGKSFTPTGMVSMIDSMGTDMGIDSSLLSIVFYDRFAGDTQNKVPVGNLLKFISDYVLPNEMFSSYLDDSMKEKAELLGKFADKKALTTPMTAKEIADVFGMGEKEIRQVMMLKYASSREASTAKMSVSAFAKFVSEEVLKNKLYSSFIDDAMREKAGLISEFSSKNKVTSEQSSDNLAQKLGIEPEQMKLLYAYYFAQQNSYTPPEMTATEFISFLQKDILTNPMFASQFDAEMASKAGMLTSFADKQTVQKQMTASELAAAFGVEESQINMLFTLKFGSSRGKTMSAEEFVDYIADEVISNPLISYAIDEELQPQIIMLQKLIDAVVSGESLDYKEAASILSMPEGDIKSLFAVYDFRRNGNNGKLSLYTVIDFINSNTQLFSSMMSEEDLAQIKMGKVLADGAVSGESYTADELAEAMGMDASQLRQLFMLYKAEHGNTSHWKMSIQEFIRFISDEILPDEAYSSMIDKDMSSMLGMAENIVDAVVSGKEYSADELATLLDGVSEELNADTVELMYLYYSAVRNSNPEWKMTIEELFAHLYNNMLNDPRFSAMIDDGMRKQILGAKTQLEDGLAQMKGKNYSLMMIDTSLDLEGEETTAFMEKLIADSDAATQKDYYLIGNTPMSYEMQQSFDKEMLFITILTAIAIFVVVALSFRSLVIPFVLVLLVQCGVYITVFSSGVRGYSMYYLALLIVQCILMGATIDYGILYTNYYRENRKSAGIRESLNKAFDGSMHTILTSGLIMVIVTGVMGFAPVDPTISQICQTVSIGALSAILLIVFVLPGLLAAFDKLVTKEGKFGKKK